jgi:microcystin-dependent protein
MSLSVTHAFVSAKADGTDNTKVQPSNWNAGHVLTALVDSILGTDSSSTTVKELSCTAAGRALLAAASVAAQKATLNIAEIPIGGGFHWFSDTLPPANGSVVWGWANGQAISRVTYATLFTLWGTQYGTGDGSSTFNVIDVRETVLVGKGGMGGTGSRSLISHLTGYNALPANSTPIGEGRHTMTNPELVAHNHGVTDPGHIHGVTDPGHSHGGVFSTTGIGYQAGGAGATTINSAASTAAANTGISINSVSTGISIQNTGSSTPFNVVQPSFPCNYVIRLA